MEDGHRPPGVEDTHDGFSLYVRVERPRLSMGGVVLLAMGVGATILVDVWGVSWWLFVPFVLTFYLCGALALSLGASTVARELLLSSSHLSVGKTRVQIATIDEVCNEFSEEGVSTEIRRGGKTILNFQSSEKEAAFIFDEIDARRVQLRADPTAADEQAARALHSLQERIRQD